MSKNAHGAATSGSTVVKEKDTGHDNDNKNLEDLDVDDDN